MENKPTVYISYSRKDKKWKDHLLTHLRALPTDLLGGLELWDDSRIRAGDDWQNEMQIALDGARAAILLVSGNFLESRFIQDKEVPYFLQRRTERGLRILPIIIQPCNWQEVSWLSQLMVLPKDGQPLSMRGENEIEAQLAAIAREIAEVVSQDKSTSEASPIEQTGPPEERIRRMATNRPELVPITKWEEYDLSPTAREVMKQALSLAANPNANFPLSTSFLLFAMIELGRDQAGTPGFLAQTVKNAPGSNYSEVLAQYLRRKGITPLLGLTVRQSPGAMSSYVAIVLEEAQSLASQTGGNTIHVRHLLAALLLEIPSKERAGALARLEEMGVEPSKLRREFLKFLDQAKLLNQSARARQAWESYLLGRGEFRNLFDYSADAARGDTDLIGIDREVNAFATLIAARSVTPPLSIGLFGDWGSGKTFFMRRLRNTVAALAKEAQNSGLMQKDCPFYKRIVQIEFNAWHYVEGNLWASLVEHIFDNLHVAGETDTTVSETLKQHLIKQLNFEEKTQQQVNAEAQAAQAAVDQTQTELNQAKEEIAKKAKKLAELSAKNARRDFPLESVVPDIRKLLQTLNLDKVVDASEDLAAALRQARAAVEQGSRVLAPLLHAQDRKRRFLFLLMGLLAGPVVGYVCGLILRGLGKEGVANLTALASGTATLLGLGARWVRRQAEWTAAQVKKVEETQAKYDKQVAQELAENTRQIKELEQQLQVLNANYLAAQRKNEEAQRRVEAARAEVAQATVTNLLAQFVQDRAASNVYSQHLGVLALIRDDFERLSGLMEEENWRLAPPQPDDTQVRWKTKKFVSLEEEEKEKNKRINRIVLYIDDLDRCPPNKVVDVLQAVHLLLAFPLFVVVVGVDARWIACSLKARYRELLHERHDEEPGVIKEAFGKATTNDYIEKIFQIPLWLRPLGQTECQRMITGLLKESITHQASEEPKRTEKLEEMKITKGVSRTGSTVSSLPEQMETLQQPSSEVVQTQVMSSSAVSSEQAEAALRVNPESLKIEKAELDFIEQLAPLLGRSPRALKRFVNVYRLIKAGLSPQEQRFFLRRVADLSDFQAVLFLLAVDTGLPAVAPVFFKTLLRSTQENAEAESPESEQSPQTTSCDLEWLIKELDSDDMLEHQADWDRLRTWLKPDDQTLKLPADLGQLVAWEARVRCYSFRSS